MFLFPFQARVVRNPLPILILSSPAVAYKAFADLSIADRSRSWSVERILDETAFLRVCLTLLHSTYPIYLVVYIFIIYYI